MALGKLICALHPDISSVSGGFGKGEDVSEKGPGE